MGARVQHAELEPVQGRAEVRLAAGPRVRSARRPPARRRRRGRRATRRRATPSRPRSGPRAAGSGHTPRALQPVDAQAHDGRDRTSPEYATVAGREREKPAAIELRHSGRRRRTPDTIHCPLLRARPGRRTDPVRRIRTLEADHRRRDQMERSPRESRHRHGRRFGGASGAQRVESRVTGVVRDRVTGHQLPDLLGCVEPVDERPRPATR